MQKSLSSTSGFTSPHDSVFSPTTPPDPSSVEETSDIFSRPPGLAFHSQNHANSAKSPQNQGQAEVGHNSTIISHSSIDHAPQRVSVFQQHPSTDVVFPDELISHIVDDFFTYVYPIVPMVHRPTFLQNFRENRHAHDANFFALVWAICASTIAHHSEKLVVYQNASTPLLIQSRLEVVRYCHLRSVQLRSPQYFDEVSHAKWATAYFFYTAFYQVGDINKSRMLEMETVLFARLLELHRISAYTGLNCIESQLRKKAFAVMMHAYVHYELQNIRKEKVAFIDCSTLHEIDLEELLPMPQDDEDITENEYGFHDTAKPSLAAGLRLRAELFLIAVTEITSKSRRGSKRVHCRCTRLIDPVSYNSHLRSRLYELKYRLDGAPWYLRQWAPRELGPSVTPDKEFQIGLIRADIHTTHLWLQTSILEHLDYLTPTLSSPRSSFSGSPQEVLQLTTSSHWEQRDEICRQMLQVLCSTPHLCLDILGIYLIYKIRDVASPLFSYLESNGENSFPTGFYGRAKQYLQEFSDKLQQLDRSGKPNFESLQTWVDTDKNNPTNGHQHTLIS